MKKIIQLIILVFAMAVNAYAGSYNKAMHLFIGEFNEFTFSTDSAEQSGRGQIQPDTLIVEGKIVLHFTIGSLSFLIYENDMYQIYSSETSNPGYENFDWGKLTIRNGKLKYKSEAFELRPNSKGDFDRDIGTKSGSNKTDPYPLLIK